VELQRVEGHFRLVLAGWLQQGLLLLVLARLSQEAVVTELLVAAVCLARRQIREHCQSILRFLDSDLSMWKER